MNARQTKTWFGAGAGSLALHAGALVGLGWITTPEPVEDQTLPQSQINIQAQQVERVKALQEDAPSERVSETQEKAPAAVQGIVPQSKALAVTAPVDRVSAQELNAPQANALQPPVQTTSASPALAETVPTTKPVTQDLQSVNVTPQSVAAISAPSQTAALFLPVPTQVNASLTVAATIVQQATPTVATTAPTSLPSAPVTQVVVANQSLKTSSLPIPAIAGKAALAWSGDAEDKVESSSLAAIQAFMRPGDLDMSDSNIGDVRDGISAILASVPCARLQTTFIPETGQLELRGHLPEDALRGPVLAALKEQVGGAIPISDQLLILPRPQCGALSGIAGVGLPQSTEQLTNPRVIGEDGFAQNYTYFDGERLELELVAPDYDGFVYVDYFTADGNVIHLQPNTIVPLEFAAAKTALTVGKDRGDKPALDITISPPFGQEIAAAFASSVPLYEGLRPLQEPAEPYLEFLKQRVSAARAADPSFKGEWVYFFISTKVN